MTKTKAIRTFCVECAGSAKDVVFCTAHSKAHEYDCPLWEHRFGSSLHSNAVKKIMADNITRHPKDFDELEGYGCDKSDFMPSTKVGRPKRHVKQGHFAPKKASEAV